MEAANLDVILARFAEHWSPKKIAQVNDYDVRIVKIQGEFTWHRHADTDEFFLVLDGRLTIQMRDRDVVLGPRELFVVPRGVEHCPRAAATWDRMRPRTAVNGMSPGSSPADPAARAAAVAVMLWMSRSAQASWRASSGDWPRSGRRGPRTVRFR